MFNGHKLVGLAGLITALSSPTFAYAQDADDTLSVSIGVDYANGEYGQGGTTEIISTPFSLRYNSGEMSFIATVPWIQIDGSSDILGGPRDRVLLANGADRRSRNGLGDISLGASYSFPEEEFGVAVDVGLRVKLPTGSYIDGLGTKKTDVALKLDLSRRVGSVTPFAGVGYRIVGKREGFDLHNAVNASAGANVALGRSTLTLLYDYREAVCNCAPDAHELHGRIGWPVGRDLFFSLYGSGGLSKGAAAYGVGSMLTYRLF